MSQLFFDEALEVSIYDSQPNYEPVSGQGYQPNDSDMVISESGLAIADVAWVA